MKTVTVTVYLSSLCPDCIEAVTKQIYPAYIKLAPTGILNLQFIPYGNAHAKRIGEKYEFSCQHGPDECLGNKMETCAIHHSSESFTNQSRSSVDFINCMENYGPTLVNSEYCAITNNLSWQLISACAHGTEGDELLFKMAEMTDALNPPHTSVPWYSVNGVHSEEIQEGLLSDMLTYVCKVYTGPKPEVCVPQ